MFRIVSEFKYVVHVSLRFVSESFLFECYHLCTFFFRKSLGSQHKPACQPKLSPFLARSLNNMQMG